jgi:4-amino-4-deoxy-L-arabinose transferase-like glycosyltransferase
MPSMHEGSLDPDAAAAGAGPGAASWFSRSGWAAGLSIAVLAILLNLAGNGATGLWDRDEPRYAVAVREMRARGDWVFPTFNGQPRYHKPILIYWLMGLSTAVAGDTPLGARLVSALAGTGTCLLAWALGRRILGARGGALAGLMLAVAPIMVAESKLATTDATLVCLLLACQFCLWILARRPSRAFAGVFWCLLGLACLTKGPVGPLFLVVSTLLAWWWGWPLPLVWKRLHPRWGLPALGLLALPWYLIVAVATRGEYLRFAVGTQIMQRVTTGMEEHGGFPGYYVVLSTLVFFPWSTLVPAAFWGAWQRRRANPDLTFLLGWAVGPLVMLECLPTRLIHYYVPAYPACALLVAWLVESIAGEGVSVRRWPLGRLGMGLLGGLGIAGTVALAAAAAIVPGATRFPLLIIAALCGAATLLGMLGLQRGRSVPATFGLGTAWALILLVLCGWLIPVAEPLRTSRRVGQRLGELAKETGIEPVLMNYQEPGVIYALGRPVASFRDRDGFFELLDRHRQLLTVLTPDETVEYREWLNLDVQPIDDIEGFSLTKGRSHILRFAILRRAGPQSRGVESTARGADIEQSLVE